MNHLCRFLLLQEIHSSSSMTVNAEGISPLIVKPTFVRVVGWVNIVFFLFCAIMAWRAGQGNASLVLLLFVALGAYLVLFSGNLEMNAETIVYRTALARFEIRWDEVISIELDKQGSNIVFWGSNKRLVALGPMFWTGEKMKMLLLMSAQVEKLGIKTQQSEMAMFRLSKNTKVRV